MIENLWCNRLCTSCACAVCIGENVYCGYPMDTCSLHARIKAQAHGQRRPFRQCLQCRDYDKGLGNVKCRQCLGTRELDFFRQDLTLM